MADFRLRGPFGQYGPAPNFMEQSRRAHRMMDERDWRKKPPTFVSPPVDTGYEGKEETPESRGKVWTVREMDSMLGSGTVLQVLVNNEPRGILDLRDKAEVEWITSRISGSQQ